MIDPQTSHLPLPNYLRLKIKTYSRIKTLKIPEFEGFESIEERLLDEIDRTPKLNPNEQITIQIDYSNKNLTNFFQDIKENENVHQELQQLQDQQQQQQKPWSISIIPNNISYVHILIFSNYIECGGPLNIIFLQD